jgi:putative two-component system response regulator
MSPDNVVAAALDNALAARDRLVRQHCVRVGVLGRRLAELLALPADETTLIELGGALHDVGKIGIPDQVLMKPGPLTPEERLLMNRHPSIGADIVPFEAFSAVASVIRHHHERIDGRGYPDGLTGAAIPLGARIIAVADFYDALTSDRPYRSAMPHHDAIQLLAAEAGRGLDEAVVEAFLESRQ